MDEAKFYNDDGMYIPLPLTQPTGKVRIKERNSFCEYGVPVAVRQVKLSLRNYVEWQIGYDYDVKKNNKKKKENRKKTTLLNFEFKDYSNRLKLPYELSEIVFYSWKVGYITDKDIADVYRRISKTEKTLDVIDEMQITRTNPIQVKFSGVDFYKMNVSYPLIVHKFGDYDVYAEVINREKQRAVGVQPMLYVCLPITSVQFDKNPLGRVLDSKERGKWIIGETESKISP